MRDLLASGANAGLWARIKSRIVSEVTSQVSVAFAGVSSVPVGTVSPYAGSSTPANWLFCNGSAVNRTTYANLFAVIGTTYGAGDGSTTFNLPDLRGRVVIAQDNMGGVGAAGRVSAATSLNYSAGAATHSLSIGEMPNHDHGGSATTSSNGSHSHGTGSVSYPYFAVAAAAVGTIDAIQTGAGADGVMFVSGGSAGAVGTTASTGAHTHTVTVGAQGSGTGHNNLQPLLTLNYIIRA